MILWTILRIFLKNVLIDFAIFIDSESTIVTVHIVMTTDDFQAEF